MPSSFTPSRLRSWISCARAISMSEKLQRSFSRRGRANPRGPMHPAPRRRAERGREIRAPPWSHLHSLARDVGLRPPLGDEPLELRIGFFRERHLERDIFVAPATGRTGSPLPFEPEHRAGVGPFRYRHGHGAGRGSAPAPCRRAPLRAGRSAARRGYRRPCG